MEHWHDCETYRGFGFQCPPGLHPKKEKEDRESIPEPSSDELAFPWEFILPAAGAAALGVFLRGYFREDADADKIRRFPMPKTRRMPDIPEELAALVVTATLLLLLRGSVRSVATALIRHAHIRTPTAR